MNIANRDTYNSVRWNIGRWIATGRGWDIAARQVESLGPQWVEAILDIASICGEEEALGWAYHSLRATGRNHIADARELRRLAIGHRIPWDLY